VADALDTEDRLERALAVAYRYLNPRERTEAEVRGRLAREGVDPQDIERSLGTLVEQGYVDDARFARLFSHDKRALEEWGGDRIRRALLSRGVDPELVEEALADEDEDEDGDMERALALLRRRFPSPAWDRRERDRALGVLIRKGYDSELALDALNAHVRATEGR
jgi:regulatory protein